MPQPARTSQSVPVNSAAARRPSPYSSGEWLAFDGVDMVVSFLQKCCHHFVVLREEIGTPRRHIAHVKRITTVPTVAYGVRDVDRR
ncbi:hypothetical protein GCM10027080_23340 [Pedococcus soli]